MAAIGYTIRHGNPFRTVHISKNMEHLNFLQKYRHPSHLLAFPPSFKWKDLDQYHGLDMSRICACMGFPNPIWSLEIINNTPIKRLLIDDRLIDFQKLTLERVEVVNY